MSYNKSLFQGVPKKNVNKSRFDLSHEWKSQMLPGYLTPVLTMETLPLDEWSINSEFLFRFASMYFPAMAKMTMRADYYYIPNRILWTYQGEANKGWAKWIAEDADQTHPYFASNQITLNNSTPLHITGYMGLPLLNSDEVTSANSVISDLNAMPLSAYLKIWDEYYRVPQLEDEKWFPLAAGNNSVAFQAAINPGGLSQYYPVLSAKWEKDYFTSALPTPQIGDAVQIPMVGDLGLPTNWLDADGNPVAGGGSLVVDGGDGHSEVGGSPVGLDIQETAATLRDLRLAEVLQSYYERIMKVGQRYRDFIEGLWGDDPQPMSVDVPVLLGSVFGRVQIADVMTQAFKEDNSVRTGDYTGQANMYSNDNKTIKYYCREHGWLMCILQVNANTSYGQGVARFWRRSIQTDYPLDMFSGIGDQEIAKEEVLYNFKIGQNSKNAETFGYIPRHAEMKYQNDIWTMQLGYTSGLSQHLGRWWDQETIEGTAYDTNIEIDSVFVSSAPEFVGGHRLTDVFRILPGKAVTQVGSEGVIYAHIFHSISVERALPFYSTPKLT